MSVSFIADVHVGNFRKFGGVLRGSVNDRASAVLATLETAVIESYSRDDEALVICGDLFDYARPEPALISAVADTLRQHRSVHILVGNHDMTSTMPGDNAVSVLNHLDNVTTYERPGIVDFASCRLILMPFKSGAPADWLSESLRLLFRGVDAPDVYTIMATHFGISDDGTPYYLDETAGSIRADKLAKICNDFGVHCVMAGDWHRHAEWHIDGVHMVQVGSLAPSRFPPNYEHGDRGPMVCLEDNGTTSVLNIPGPRFLRESWDDGALAVERALVTKTMTPSTFVKIDVKPAALDDAKAWANEQGFAGVEFNVNRTEQIARARTAAFEAKQASTMNDAVRLFVEAMPLDDGVDRDTVLQHCRRLIG